MNASGSPLVASVVLNWNNYEDTSECLESLSKQRYEPHEIVVVDNGSSDGSVDRIEAEFHDITVLQNEENRGFAGGMNRGIEWARDRGTDYVWILNNDTLFPDDTTLGDLVEVIESHADLGVVTPRVHNYPNTNKVWFERGVVDLSRARAAHAKTIESSDRLDNTLIKDEYIPLCCALVATEVFSSVGPLPEGLFLYYEDVMFGVETRQVGYQLATHENTRVWHHKTKSTEGHLGTTISYYKTRNRILIARDLRTEISPWFVISYLKWFVLQLGNRLIHGQISGAIAFVRGALDGLRGQTGRGPYP